MPEFQHHNNHPTVSGKGPEVEAAAGSAQKDRGVAAEALNGPLGAAETAKGKVEEAQAEDEGTIRELRREKRGKELAKSGEGPGQYWFGWATCLKLSWNSSRMYKESSPPIAPIASGPSAPAGKQIDPLKFVLKNDIFCWKNLNLQQFVVPKVSAHG